MSADPYCLACGGPLEMPLAQLGSLRCLDCRGNRASLDAMLVAPPAGRRFRSLLARIKREGKGSRPTSRSDDPL